MRIFITGASGFIGKNLLDFYSKHQTFGWSRGMDLATELDNFKPDLIIHCAAEIYNPDLMWDSNIVLTKTCLDYVKVNPQTQMVHLGSSGEYGPVSKASSEKDLIDPVDMYQATKGMATLMCQGYARNFNLNISIARPYSVFGPGEKPHRLFPRLYKAYIKNEPMVLFQGYHDFIYIDDFVRGIDILATYESVPRGEIINLGSGVQYSNFEINDLFIKYTGIKNAPVEKKETLQKLFESNFWVCDTTYAWQKYKFKTRLSVDEGIVKFLNQASY